MTQQEDVKERKYDRNNCIFCLGITQYLAYLSMDCNLVLNISNISKTEGTGFGPGFLGDLPLRHSGGGWNLGSRNKS